MCQYVIELTGLTKKYGDFTAVNDLNLQIRKGEIFGLLGPNGAGKSTTILMMLGLTEPTTGSVKVCDIDSTTHPIEVKRKVGYLPEDVGFYEDMTGIENLVYTAALNGIRRKEARAKAERLLDRIGLVKEADKKAGKYSKGMRQRLGFKSRKTKSDGREKRKAIFEAKTKCAPKIRVALLSVRLSGQNTSVVQTPFESCLNDAFLLKFPLKYHLKLIANSAEIRIFT